MKKSNSNCHSCQQPRKKEDKKVIIQKKLSNTALLEHTEKEGRKETFFLSQFFVTVE